MTLTPYALSLVERFDADAAAIGAHLRNENRYHAVGHTYRDPEGTALEMVIAYEDATPEQIAQCREVNERIRAELTGGNR